MRKPAAMLLPPVECMPFAHFYPVMLDVEAEAELESTAKTPTGDEQPKLGFWERVLNSLAALSWPYGYPGM